MNGAAHATPKASAQMPIIATKTIKDAISAATSNTERNMIIAHLFV